MARTKKEEALSALQEEKQKLNEEIEKTKKKIADAEAKRKKLEERIRTEQVNEITKSGFSLDDIIALVERLNKNKLSLNDVLSLLGDDSDTTAEKASVSNETQQEPVNEDIDKMMASLPSYD